MHILSIPRHRIETTLGDYAGIATSLLRRGERPGAIATFEQEFAAYLGCRHAIAVSSGRLGIHLILEALDPHPGSEVIVPAFNLFAVIERFCQFGIAPRFCDIRHDDLNIDSTAVEARITPNTRYLLTTHMFGHPADMERLVALAKWHDLILLEDCAHALGSRIGDRFVGTFGQASIFSFSVLKLVTTFGGGMIATNDDDLAERIRRRLTRLRDRQPPPSGLKRAITGAVMDIGTRKAVFSLGAWPALRLIRAIRPGFQQQIMTETPRLDREFDPGRVPPLHAFQARLGSSQLRRVEAFIDRRLTVGEWLDKELSSIPQLSVLRRDARPAQSSITGDEPTMRSNGLYYGVLADRAADLREFLFRRGIDSETSEYLNCSELKMYSACRADCPVAQDVQARILRLPNYPTLSRRDVQRIGRAIRAFYNQSA